MAELRKHKNKLYAIGILLLIAVAVLFANHRYRPLFNNYPKADAPATQPLPPLSDAGSRQQSYVPARGDIKYRVVAKPVVSVDQATAWNIYTSQEYGFSFIFPTDYTLNSTEALGYQLPPNQAYKGSRDNFQIIMTNARAGYAILLMNSPDFAVPTATSTSDTTISANGLSFRKQIYQSLDPNFKNSEILVFQFEKNNKKFIWYGAFNNSDFESINEFQSMVTSTKFSK